ncbi:MAG TPA: sugar ABC transporter permease [Polyangia bacterium]|jgi:ABC-type sugar transport system permease subunit
MTPALRSGLVTYLGGALLVAAIAVGLFVRARNLTADQAMERGAGELAVGLAAQAGRGSPDAAVAALGRTEGVRSAFVLADAESASPRYGFLKRRRYLATSAVELRGKPLEHKEVYDLVSSARTRGGPVVRVVPAEPGRPAQLLTVAPVAGGRLIAGLVMAPNARPQPLPGTFWLLLLTGAVLSAGCGRLAPRARHVVAGTLALAFAAWAYAALLRPFGPVGTTLGLPLVATAAGLAVLFAVLGGLGIGRRFFAALGEHRYALAYISPAMLGIGVLVLIPFVVGVSLAFFEHRHGTFSFVGLTNFKEILSGGGHALSDPLNFYFTFGVTMLWTFVNVFLHVTIGLALALILKQQWLQLKGIYRVLLIIPWAVPSYITALIWKGMFHQQYGAVNHILAFFGLTPVSWFSSFTTAMTANVVTNTWLGFPFMMVICLGALQSIPSDIYEAAEVDGASRWQQFLRLTLPLLRPALFPAIINGCIWTFNQFNIIYLVSRGEPGGKTNILITEAYRWAFERGERYGLAAAYAVIIFVILLGYSWAANRVAKGTEGAYG